MELKFVPNPRHFPTTFPVWVIFCSHLGTGTSAALEFGLSWPGRRKMATATVVLNLCDFADGNGNATVELS